MTALLAVERLHARYDGVAALNGVDLEVRPGEVVAVLGANGAGKTTLLRSISGLIKQTEGSIRLNGKPIDHLDAYAISARGVLHVPEGRQAFNRLTVMENLKLGLFRTGRMSGHKPADFDKVFKLFPRLAERHRQAAGTLSGGEQQMLVMGRAMMGEPTLLMLDEPSMGLSPAMTEVIFDALVQIKTQTALLIVEQNVGMVLSLAQRMYLMRSGSVVRACKAADISTEEIHDAYLSAGNKAVPQPGLEALSTPC
jgi:branched-chain amino acid transport system ATP-binding protein